MLASANAETDLLVADSAGTLHDTSCSMGLNLAGRFSYFPTCVHGSFIGGAYYLVGRGSGIGQRFVAFMKGRSSLLIHGTGFAPSARKLHARINDALIDNVAKRAKATYQTMFQEEFASYALFPRDGTFSGCFYSIIQLMWH